MAHNFKLTGYAYVSKDGSDANSGLTPDLPKLTVQAGLNLITLSNQILVIGAGVYRETNLSRLTNTNGNIIIGDGEVIIDCNDTFAQIQFGQTGGSNYVIKNITFRNYRFLDLALTLTFQLYGGTFAIGTYQSVAGQFGGSHIHIWKSKLIGVTAPLSGSGIATLDSCIVMSSFLNVFSVSNTTLIQNNYIDPFSCIRFNLGATSNTFNFNNIQGKVMMTTGTYSGIALSFADHRTYYPTYNVQSFSADPLFNDVQNLNFTLQSGSPHIRAASDYISNIGGTEYAVYKAANSTEFTSGATLTNVTLRGDNSYSITSGTEGRIVTAPISVQWPIIKPLTRIEWVGGLEFNKSVTAGTAGNTNVPAYYTETTGAGASPDRLTVLMRYSTQQTSPTLSSHWDNGGYWTAGNWVEVELNSKPKIDANGIGNGDATYIEFSGLGDIAPSWIQLDIKLRNDYNP